MGAAPWCALVRPAAPCCALVRPAAPFLWCLPCLLVVALMDAIHFGLVSRYLEDQDMPAGPRAGSVAATPLFSFPTASKHQGLLPHLLPFLPACFTAALGARWRQVNGRQRFNVLGLGFNVGFQDQAIVSLLLPPASAAVPAAAAVAAAL